MIENTNNLTEYVIILKWFNFITNMTKDIIVLMVIVGSSAQGCERGSYDNLHKIYSGINKTIQAIP